MSPCTDRDRSCVGRVAALAIAAILAVSAAAPTAAAQVAVDFPLGLAQLPRYDRVDGLSLPVAPTITFGDDRLVIEPVLTYRSHLGKVDPSLLAKFAVAADSAYVVQLAASRGTFTNDRWIRSDLVNSLLAISLGRDARNYFRGDRAEGRFVARLPIPSDVIAEAFVGARTENDWSTGWRAGERRGPFSIVYPNDDINGIDRPNPEVDRGHITSGLAGGRLEFVTDRNTIRLGALLEAATSGSVTGSFQQLTLDGHTDVPTVGTQRFELDGHLVTSRGDRVPAQRYAYVGGSGTLATLDLLQLGGDHLFWVDTRYVIPIRGLAVPYLGELFVAPHFAAGAASVGGFGRVTENIGFRLGAGLVQVDVVVNPHTHERSQGIGISFSR